MSLFNRNRKDTNKTKRKAAKKNSNVDIVGGSKNGSDGQKSAHGITNKFSHYDHAKLMLEARRVVQKSSIAAAALRNKTTSTIGTGLYLNAMPNYKILKITPEQADEWAQIVQSEFSNWAQSKKVSRAENMNFAEIQTLAEKTISRDGGFLCRLIYDNEDLSLPLPFQLVMYNYTQLKGYDRTYVNGFVSQLETGIKYDSRDREVSYDLIPKGGNLAKSVTLSRRSADGKKITMIHASLQEYIGQSTGITEFAPVIQESDSLSEFINAMVKLANNQAGFSLVREYDNKDGTYLERPNWLDEDKGAGPVEESSEGSDSGDTEDNSTISCQEYDGGNRVGDGTVVWATAPGEKLKTLTLSSPPPGFNEFVETMISAIAPGLGIPPEVLLMKFGKNYSASRAALQLYQRIIEAARARLDSQFLSEVYEMFLGVAIAKGLIVAPGWSDPRLREAWCRHIFLGDGTIDLDPEKTEKGNLLKMAIGKTTPNQLSPKGSSSANIQENLKNAEQVEKLLTAYGHITKANIEKKEVED